MELFDILLISLMAAFIFMIIAFIFPYTYPVRLGIYNGFSEWWNKEREVLTVTPPTTSIHSSPFQRPKNPRLAKHLRRFKRDFDKDPLKCIFVCIASPFLLIIFGSIVVLEFCAPFILFFILAVLLLLL